MFEFTAKAKSCFNDTIGKIKSVLGKNNPPSPPLDGAMIEIPLNERQRMDLIYNKNKSYKKIYLPPLFSTDEDIRIQISILTALY